MQCGWFSCFPLIQQNRDLRLVFFVCTALNGDVLCCVTFCNLFCFSLSLSLPFVAADLAVTVDFNNLLYDIIIIMQLFANLLQSFFYLYQPLTHEFNKNSANEYKYGALFSN